MNEVRIVDQIHKILDGTNIEEDKEHLSILSDWLYCMELTRAEMIELIKRHPHVLFAHRFFSQGEYIYSDETGVVYDENGYLFEDWHSEGPGCHDGIRRRTGGPWERGWQICISEQQSK